jgi:hypothetical protein
MRKARWSSYLGASDVPVTFVPYRRGVYIPVYAAGDGTPWNWGKATNFFEVDVHTV